MGDDIVSNWIVRLGIRAGLRSVGEGRDGGREGWGRKVALSRTHFWGEEKKAQVRAESGQVSAPRGCSKPAFARRCKLPLPCFVWLLTQEGLRNCTSLHEPLKKCPGERREVGMVVMEEEDFGREVGIVVMEEEASRGERRRPINRAGYKGPPGRVTRRVICT